MSSLLKFINKRINIILPLVPIIIFIIIVFINAPLRETFEYNPDESTNLMKSQLFLKGFSFYKQIWSDQPPLIPVFLAYWFKLVTPTVYHGRILILIFSIVFLWTFYQTIRINWGHPAASIAVFFLILSQAYLRLSVSIMDVSIPLTLNMLSIYCISLYRKYHSILSLVISGVFLALALQCKLITAFLIPIIMFEIIRPKEADLKYQKQYVNPIIRLSLWLASFFTVYFFILVIFFYPDFNLIIEQLVKPHLTKYIFIDNKLVDFTLISKMLFLDYDIVLLALISIIAAIRQKDLRLSLPVLWVFLIFLILLVHTPLWDHYYLLISIPLCWLAAIQVGGFLHTYLSNMKPGLVPAHKKKYTISKWLMAGLIILVILRIPAKYDRACKFLWGETTAKEKAVTEVLLKYKKHTHWLLTDRPIFAFYTNMLVPPELAVISQKRIWILTKDSLSDSFINIFEKYKPELLLFAAFFNRIADFSPEVSSYIEHNYYKVYSASLSHKIAALSAYVDYTVTPIGLPFGHYLPKSIKFARNKWLRNFIWHCKIFVTEKKYLKNEFSANIDTNIYVRKDTLGLSQPSNQIQ